MDVPEDVSSIQQLQDDERIAIDAIFGGEARFVECKWKIWKPIDVSIHLEPIESASRCGQGSYVSVDLHVVCPDEYPFKVPRLILENGKGLSNDDLTCLTEVLAKQSQELLGMSMILELCESVRQFLYEKNAPPKGSFHDDMLKNKEIAKNEMKRQRANSERVEMERIAQERERLRIESQWKREEDEADDRRKKTDATEKYETRFINGRSVRVLDTPAPRKRLNPLCREWMALYEDQPIMISEWVFQFTLGRKESRKTSQASDFRQFLADFAAVEQELSAVLAVVPSTVDKTLVPYAFIEVERLSETPINLHLKVFIAHRLRNTECHFPNVSDSVRNDVSVIRRLAAHAICALRWLHEQQLFHGSLMEQCLWLEKDGTFRISDFRTLKLLLGLVDSFNMALGCKPIARSPVEEKSPKRKDLFNLGVMLDGLFSRSPSDSRTSDRSNQLSDFIKACQSAKNVDELIDHSYLIQDLVVSCSGDTNPIGHVERGDKRSRLAQEFLFLKWVGKGGFGDVILARNKLDGNDYAVKRIPLNPKSERLNRRITREAKLFSKLNHPNVVRYYSAWIEDVDRVSSTTSGSSLASEAKKSPLHVECGDSMLPTRLRNIDNLAVGGVGLNKSVTRASEWSTSYRIGSTTEESSSSSDDSRPVKTLFSPSHRNDDDDDFDILFEDSDAMGNPLPTSSSSSPERSIAEAKLKLSRKKTPILESVEESIAPTAATGETKDTSTPALRLLYIQMEYCERSTLRSLIDSNELNGNARSVWRIFGEILLGLQYIHRLGMIHRDIKPMNILLDVGDRVKIGDFGLATRDLLLKKESVAGPNGLAPNGDHSTTGQTRDIGTELYMAPELFRVDDNEPYSSKIDIFSSGIVLFEMFYRPLPPGMERNSTIQKLKKESVLPVDFGFNLSKIQSQLAQKLIEWMLKPNASDRPTVSDLLASDQLPLTDLDDSNFQQVFLKTVKKRSGRLYHWIVDALMKEEISATAEYCFDQRICMDKFTVRKDLNVEDVREELVQILGRHSFDHLSSHLLVPSSTANRHSSQRSKPFRILTAAGLPVCLPTDLRQNFVRYCARNCVNRQKRFAVNRVFNADDGGSSHPVERWECSIDSIGPSSTSLTLTVEILAVLAELAAISLRGVRCILTIGHIGLLRGAIQHLNIGEDGKTKILQALHSITTTGKVLNENDRADLLGDLIGARPAHALFSLLGAEPSISMFKESCRALLRSRDEAVKELVRSSLSEMEMVADLLRAATDESCRVEIRFDASLTYRPNTFSDGLTFCLTAEVPHKRGLRSVLLAAGGRYDSALRAERHAEDLVPPAPLCLVGCTVFLEVAGNLRKYINKESPEEEVPIGRRKALVCSHSSEFLHGKFILARMLWNAGIPTDVLHDSIESLDQLLEHCSRNGISHLMTVIGQDEVLVQKSAPDQKKVRFSKAVEMVSHDADDTNVGHPLTTSRSSTHIATATSISHHHHPVSTVASPATLANCGFNVALPERSSAANRKKYEMQARNHLADVVGMFSGRAKIEVVVTGLSFDLVKLVAASLSRSSTVTDIKSLFDGLGRQHGKSKEDLECLYLLLKHLFSPQPRAAATVSTSGGAAAALVAPLVILYQHAESKYCVIV